jgi:DNA-binding XRE family transcriptional regulator
MTRNQCNNLAKAGYRVTTTQEFLGLSDEEMAVIDLKVLLIEKLKELRSQKKMTQHQLARLLGSSQSRVAMLEKGRPGVSL